VAAGPGPGHRPRTQPRTHRRPVPEGHRNRGRHRLPARGASPATDPQDPPPPRSQVAHRNRLRRDLPVGHRRPPPTDRGLATRALGHREQNPLGPRRYLRRRPIPSPHQRRTSGHGHPEKHRHQPPAPGRRDQHRRRPTTSEPRSTPTDHTTADLLNYDFAGALTRRVMRQCVCRSSIAVLRSLHGALVTLAARVTY